MKTAVVDGRWCVVKETVENAIHEALCVKDCLFETLYGDFIPADG